MSKPKNKEEYRQQLADMFAHVLEEKGLEWHQEWTQSGRNGAPYNIVTGAKYRGSNSFYLSLVALVNGYHDPRWMTMVQIMDKKGKYHPGQKWHLQAGSKAVWVEYWYPYDTVNRKAATWEEYRKALSTEGRDENEFRLSTRYTPVFNASLVEGVPALEQPRQPETAIETDELVKSLSKNMGVPIIHGGDQAFYRPKQDEIHLPEPSAFESEYAYNATALHELAHATGHPSRLNRNQSGGFGSDTYAYEELVAEMASCFMGVSLSTEMSQQHIDNHKAYVQGWIQGILDQPNLLIHAIKDAQGAADYMEMCAALMPQQEYEQRRDAVLMVSPDPGMEESSIALIEEEKQCLFRSFGKSKADVFDWLDWTAQYSQSPEQRQTAQGVMDKLRSVPERQCMALIRDIKEHYQLPYPPQTMGERIAVARQRAGAETADGQRDPTPKARER